MPRNLSLLIFSAVLAVFYNARNARATTPEGFTGTTLWKGRFATTKLRIPGSSADERLAQTWLSLQGAATRTATQKTAGQKNQEAGTLSDLYVQSNVWEPGGSTGWHTHPGHSLIIVTKGAVTEYHGDDPDCTPHVYTEGMTFEDCGDGHVHILRNEGEVVATTTTLQLIPAGTVRRIDAADPGNCHF